ncbi:hypothetical protein GCM10023237_37940 [Streptomyces coeruleoprunus]
MSQQTTLTTMSPPVHVDLPGPPPRGDAKCRVCAALRDQRRTAERSRDGSRVSDCNVELAAHPNHRRGPQRQP